MKTETTSPSTRPVLIRFTPEYVEVGFPTLTDNRLVFDKYYNQDIEFIMLIIKDVYRAYKKGLYAYGLLKGCSHASYLVDISSLSFKTYLEGGPDPNESDPS